MFVCAKDIVSSFIIVKKLIMCDFILITRVSFSYVNKKFVELPIELWYIIMSPISLSIFYSFAFFPSIMYRLKGLFGVFNFKNMHLDHSLRMIFKHGQSLSNPTMIKLPDSIK